ncbi:hypothetical protein SLA2020_025540 [Shorea laevis]
MQIVTLKFGHRSSKGCNHGPPYKCPFSIFDFFHVTTQADNFNVARQADKIQHPRMKKKKKQKGWHQPKGFKNETLLNLFEFFHHCIIVCIHTLFLTTFQMLCAYTNCKMNVNYWKKIEQS